MKRISALLLALLMLAALAACGGNTDNPNNSDPALKTIKIGVYEPASGDNGAGGKQETLGIQYANSLTPTVEIGGETYKVELVTVDNESSTDKAASAANTLVAAGVSVVLGSYGSSVSIAASDIFRDANIPVIGVTCTNPQVTQGNTHYFRICFLDPFQGTVLANFAADEFKATKAYVLAKLGDDYSVGLANYFVAAFEALGGEVRYETFPDGNSDFNSYIANAKNFGAQVFFSPVSAEAAANIIEQAPTQGLTIPLLAGDTWDSNVITGAAQGKDVSIYVTTFYQEGGDPTFDAGIKAWINGNATNLSNNNGNDMIAAVSAMGFDAYYVALEALKAAGTTDSKAVNTALWNIQYDGVTGHIAFDEVGDANRSEAVVKKANTADGVWDFVAIQGIK
ncbi:MAG: ABC transporter substrate-binding protein [Oscillospiraceae bacterium]|jgi:branched-chain amino acid transport system substrate-binding protein|nr:ABC transporter substrate-binding protein [Oscillospiraceae bacterium]